MKLIKLDDTYSVICESKKTRHGFKHEVNLMNNNGYQVGSAKVCYLNRTWERFQYETAILKLIDIFFKDDLENKKYTDIVKDLN